MNKRAAMEMSVGTLVTIVLLMAVLGLGLFLVTNIFSGSTDTVDLINDKVIGEINDLFSDSGAAVVVMLGADKKAKIKRGTDDFGIAIGVEVDGAASRDRAKYKLSFPDSPETDDCVSQLSTRKDEGEAKFAEMMGQKPTLRTKETEYSFDEYEGARSYARLSFNIPKTSIKCSQKIYVDVIDNKDSNNPVGLGGTFFKIQII
ncbi:MAG: hypothetical protein ABIH59_01020 [archaeon]